MDTATRMVLGGEATIPIEMKTYCERFEDEEGLEMFRRVQRHLEQAELAMQQPGEEAD